MSMLQQNDSDLDLHTTHNNGIRSNKGQCDSFKARQSSFQRTNRSFEVSRNLENRPRCGSGGSSNSSGYLEYEDFGNPASLKTISNLTSMSSSSMSTEESSKMGGDRYFRQQQQQSSIMNSREKMKDRSTSNASTVIHKNSYASIGDELNYSRTYSLTRSDTELVRGNYPTKKQRSGGTTICETFSASENSFDAADQQHPIQLRARPPIVGHQFLNDDELVIGQSKALTIESNDDSAYDLEFEIEDEEGQSSSNQLSPNDLVDSPYLIYESISTINEKKSGKMSSFLAKLGCGTCLAFQP